VLERGAGRPPSSDDHVDVESDQLGRKRRKARSLAPRPARFSHEMLPIHIAELAQANYERVDCRVKRPWTGEVRA